MSPRRRKDRGTIDTRDDVEDYWDEIGFHRPLGGLLYNLLLALVGGIFGVAFNLWLVPNYIFPFPQALGWQKMVQSMFALYFTVADMGVVTALQRFIGEYNVKSPKKSIKYLQFFIWFQMITGLIQITIIAIWVLAQGSKSEIAYASYLFLIYSCVQYPGMFSVFHNALNAFQRFDKASVIYFSQTVILENTTRVACILLGRWIGAQNPAVGEVFGAAIGSILGAYLDDIIVSLIAAKWVLNILREINPAYKISDVFRPSFGAGVVKESLWYGVKAMLPSMVVPAANLIVVGMYVRWLPNYAAIVGIDALAYDISVLIGTFRFESASTIAESYNNDKMELTRDYINRIYKWASIANGFMSPFLIAGAPILGILMGESFTLAVQMIPIYVIGRLFLAYATANDRIFLGANRPEYQFIDLLCEHLSRLLFLYIFLVPLPLGILSLPVSRAIGFLIKFAVSLLFLKKKIIEINFNKWYVVVAPYIAWFAELLYIYLLFLFIFPGLTAITSDFVGAAVIIVLSMIGGPFLVFFPVYAACGGWDSESLKILHKAMEMSGPSKFIVYLIYRVSSRFSEMSPLYDKYGRDITNAKREAEELMSLRRTKLAEP